MEDIMLTTIDNPYSPFDEWDQWFLFDTVYAGYYTCAYLSRMADIPDDASEVEADIITEEAMYDICEHNPTGMYITVTRKDYEKGGIFDTVRESKIDISDSDITKE